MPLLYESIAVEIEEQIRRGTIRAGDRIPSVRRFSTQKKVSVSTVLQAYLSLEGKGLIEARPQSGYYVRAAAFEGSLEPALTEGRSSPTKVGVCDFARSVITADVRPGTIALAAAEVSPLLLPTTELARAIHAASREMKNDIHLYYRPPGHPGLAREIAKRLLSQGCPIDPDELTITVGGMEALNLALRAVAKPGDSVLVESPTYYGILQVLEGMGVKAIEMPMNPRTGIDLKALRALLAKCGPKALICVPDFQNPLGSRMPAEAKAELYKLAQKHDLPIIEDAVYSELAYDGKIAPTIKQLDRKGNVILLSSFSKILSPGLRLGWIVGGKWSAQIRNLKFVNTLSNPGILQAAAAQYLKTGGLDRHLRRLRTTLQGQMLVYQNEVARSFPEGTRFTRPEGGFVLWAELPEKIDCVKLHSTALAARPAISFAPGTIFSASGKFRNCLRLNCGAPWTPEIAGGIRRLGELAKDQV